MRFLIINGPNLNLLGAREPETYGTDTLDSLSQQWNEHGADSGHTVETFQSNHEGALIDAIHGARGNFDGIVINPGAYTHYSYALHDALTAVDIPAVEVHLSNIKEREPWRATSVVAPAAVATIFGRGSQGYIDAMNHLSALHAFPSRTVEYGHRDDQILDLRVPDTPRGAVMLIHGGFWRTQWMRDIMDPMSVALASSGWITANIEYRRGPGSFGASTDDVTSALAHVRSWLSTVAPGMPVSVIGHSAGGYLAMRLAQFDSDIATTIGLAPVVDLAGISALRRDDDPVATYLGASPGDVPELWNAARLTGIPASPTTIVHGKNDEDVPVEHSESFASQHKAIPLVVTDDDHMACIDPESHIFTEVKRILASAR